MNTTRRRHNRARHAPRKKRQTDGTGTEHDDETHHEHAVFRRVLHDSLTLPMEIRIEPHHPSQEENCRQRFRLVPSWGALVITTLSRVVVHRPDVTSPPVDALLSVALFFNHAQESKRLHARPTPTRSLTTHADALWKNGCDD